MANPRYTDYIVDYTDETGETVEMCASADGICAIANHVGNREWVYVKTLDNSPLCPEGKKPDEPCDCILHQLQDASSIVGYTLLRDNPDILVASFAD